MRGVDEVLVQADPVDVPFPAGVGTSASFQYPRKQTASPITSAVPARSCRQEIPTEDHTFPEPGSCRPGRALGSRPRHPAAGSAARTRLRHTASRGMGTGCNCRPVAHAPATRPGDSRYCSDTRRHRLRSGTVRNHNRASGPVSACQSAHPRNLPHTNC